MSKWAKLKALSGPERAWLWRAWLLLPVVKILLWSTGYRRTLALLRRWFPLRADSPQTGLAGFAQACGRLVSVAANHSLLEVNCLPRSLVLWALLRRAGLAADLRIGVQKEAVLFAAHAWVEYAGAPVGEQGSERYAPILSSFTTLESETQ